MDFVARLKEYIEYLKLPVTQFADKAQIPRPTLSQILNGRNKKISNELIAKLHDAFPRLNVMWLLFGDGDIETTANTQTSEGKNDGFSDSAGSQSVGNEDNATSQHQNIQPSLFDQSSDDVAKKANSSQNTPQGGTAGAAPTSKGGGAGSATRPASPSTENGERTAEMPYTAAASAAAIAEQMVLSPDNTKKIQSIMVFFSDNSFEIFTPSR